MNKRGRLKTTGAVKHLTFDLEKFKCLMKKLYGSVEFQSYWINFLIAIPRVAFGMLLLFEVTRIKIGMPVDDLITQVPDEWISADWLSWIDKSMIMQIETLGYWIEGGMMILGFTTRVVAFSLAWTSLGGLFSSTSLGVWSVPLMPLFIVTCIYCTVLGSGKIGIDPVISRWFSRKKMNKRH
jgi:uncharacterized membrane protein YphA (DoxX/SURF4 family)